MRDSFTIDLNERQIKYLMDIMNNSNPEEAILKFAMILSEESVLPSQMSKYIDKLIEKSYEI